MQPIPFLSILTFFNGRKPLKQHSKVQETIFFFEIPKVVFFLLKVPTSIFDIFIFHSFGFWDYSYFHCLGSHAGVINAVLRRCSSLGQFQYTKRLDETLRLDVYTTRRFDEIRSDGEGHKTISHLNNVGRGAACPRRSLS